MSKSHQRPFVVSAPECCAPAEIERLRVDRDREIGKIHEALAVCYHNVLLFGERGTGKTFLVQLLKQELEREDPEILPVPFSASHLPHYGPQDAVSAFPRAIVLQMCAEAWRTVLGRRYSELRLSLEDIPSKITFAAAEQKILQRIYACMMAKEREAKYEMFNSVGFSAAAKGEKSERHSVQHRSSAVLPFEFFEFADEILTDVLASHGKRRIIVLCDEGNHLPMLTQHELIQRYIELFRSHKVQFLFVAGYLNWEGMLELPQCFETRLHLKGFTDMDVFHEFIERYAGDSVKVEDSAVQELWKAFQGHPRRSLAVCHECLADLVPLPDKAAVLTSEAVAPKIRECQESIEEDRKRLEREREAANKRIEPTS